jgi:hypothetical protein
MKGVYEKAVQVVAAIYEKMPQVVATIYKAAQVIAAIYEKVPQVVEAIYEKAAQVVAAIYEMMPQVVAAIYKAAHVVAAIYEKAAQVVAVIYEKLAHVVAAIYKVAQVVVAIWGFAKGHPVLCTSVALGILVILAPFVIKALGFGELGPIEGMPVIIDVKGDILMSCFLLVGTPATRWQSTYRGSVPAGSSFSFFQRRGMKLR